MKKHNAAQPVEIQKQAPVMKESEMSQASNLPKLYLFGDETSIPFASALRTRLKDQCTIMHIISSDDEMRAFFKIQSLPAAILFDNENEEMARFEPPFSEEKLATDVLEKIK